MELEQEGKRGERERREGEEKGEEEKGEGGEGKGRRKRRRGEGKEVVYLERELVTHLPSYQSCLNHNITRS